MDRLSLGVCLVTAVLTTTLAPGQEAPAKRVGPHGARERLAVRGTIEFDPDEVADALAMDMDVLVAAHPSAPLDEYLNVLRGKAKEGYLHAGFPRPTITAEVERITDRVVLTVEEGPRFVAGKINVSGAHAIDTRVLAAQLVQPQRPANAVATALQGREGLPVDGWVDASGESLKPDDAVWKPGQPVAFDEVSIETLREQIQQACADQGYYFARFALRIDEDDGNRSADLAIRIESEGPAAVVEQVVLTGLQRDAKADLLGYLQFREGNAWTLAVQNGIEQWLWNSGRFREFRVQAEPPPVAGGRFLVRIHAAEYAKAPLLSVPLSREEQVMIAASDHLANLAPRGEELIFDYADELGTVQVVVSPEFGVLAVSRHDATGPIKSAVVLSKQYTGVYLPERQLKFVGESLPIQVNLNLKAQLTDDPQRPFRFNFGIGYQTPEKANDSVPCRLTTSFSPVAFLAQIHENDAVHQWQGNVLTLTSAKSRWQFDGGTGRLHGAELFIGDGRRFTATLGLGAFSARMREIADATRDVRNEFDPRRPLASVLRPEPVEELLLMFTRRRIDIAAADLETARKLLTASVFEPLDQWIVRTIGPPRSGKFRIPATAAREGDFDDWWSMVRLSAPAALANSDRVFKRGTWPWTLFRGTAYMVGGRNQHSSVDLTDLYHRTDAGPLCHMLCAMLTSKMAPETSRRFAHRGIERLTAEALQRDCEMLFDPAFPLGQTAVRLATAVRGLSDEEAQLFTGTAWEPLVVELRTRKDPQLANLTTFLSRHWQSGVKESLQRHAASSVE